MPVRKQGGESNRFADYQEPPVTMGFTHRPARKNAEAHRALELLEDYHAKLTRPQDKQLRLAIERVIRIFKSRLFQALLEPVSYEWPLISSWYILVLITFGYLYFILVVGPHYMENRPPYKLKTFILLYNFFQILVNAWLVKEHISAGWFWKYSLICMPPETDTPSALKLTNLMWWTLMLKLIDYIETCIFVLRKKDDQVSILHVYHHLSNVAFGWYYLRYISDHRGSFITLLNCGVHVIMYIYYWITAYSSKLQRMILPIKPFITRIQMIQFVVMLLYILQGTMPGCEISKSTVKLLPFAIVNLIIFLYLFYDFYTKNFSELPKQKSA